MRVLMQTQEQYTGIEVDHLDYIKSNDTLILRDGRNIYRIVIPETTALEYITELMSKGFTDLSGFPCTVESLSATMGIGGIHAGS